MIAIESRKKRKSKINEMENNIQSKEMGYLALQQHCKKLEQQWALPLIKLTVGWSS